MRVVDTFGGKKLQGEFLSPPRVPSFTFYVVTISAARGKTMTQCNMHRLELSRHPLQIMPKTADKPR